MTGCHIGHAVKASRRRKVDLEVGEEDLKGSGANHGVSMYILIHSHAMY